MKKVFLLVLYFFSPVILFSKLYVMLPQYNCVITRENNEGYDTIRLGYIYSWQNIVLWDSCNLSQIKIENNESMSELSVIQWSVLRSAAVENLCGIISTNLVRNKLLGYTKRAQYSDSTEFYASMPTSSLPTENLSSEENSMLVNRNITTSLYYL